MNLGERSYPIVVGPSARTYLISEKRLNDSSAGIVVITDTTVRGLWLSALSAVLPVEPRVIEVPPGEASKGLATVERICEQLAAWRVDRDGVVVALGGGVVGDLGGFVAAIWQRGIRSVQVPTTLLAAVDASVGGKTGVNVRAGKNLVGAFHQPLAVVIDTEFLSSLPDRMYVAGLAESIKHAAVRDADLLDWQIAQRAAIRTRHLGVLSELIFRNCTIKADVVSRDEREAGLRAILNYGHTIGHALEAALGYELLHGECVALGMIVENEIAAARGLLERGTADRVRALIGQFGLPVRLPHAVEPDVIWRYCLVDKKNRDGAVHAVFIRAPGDPVRVHDLSLAELAAALPAVAPPAEHRLRDHGMA